MIARLFSPIAAKVLLAVVGALLITLGMAKCTIDQQAATITERVAERDRARETLVIANANHRQTKANFRSSMDAANSAHAANLARIAAARDAINQRTIDDLQTRRRDAVAGLARLRDQARSAADRDAGRPDLAAHAEATCRAYAATSCDEIPTLLKAAQDNTDLALAWQLWARLNLDVPLMPMDDPAP